jgi:predicted secreted protein
MAAITANTTTISIDGGTTDIADVTSISPIALSLATLDTSNLDSAWRTFIGGIKDGGECTFEINYDPASTSHLTIEAAIDGLERDIKVTFSDTKSMEFKAIITSFSVTASMDSVVTASLGMKISAAITFPVA